MGSSGVVGFEHTVVRASEQGRERWVLMKGISAY